MRTILLKLYKPSKSKVKIIDEAMINYNKAYRYLLEKAYENVEEISQNYKDNKGRYRASNISKWIDSDLSRELNKFDVQPFKDALKLEIGMNLASFLSLRSMQTKCRPKDSRPDIPDNLELQNLRPIYFCRYDTCRSYCLLYDRETDRYFVKLYLLNSHNAKGVGSTGLRHCHLQYIFSKGGFLEDSRKKETFIIVPLSFGKYQEQFLRKAISDPGIIRTAKLIFKKGCYYMAVSIDNGMETSIKTETYMGISRGINNALNYTIMDLEGVVVKQGHIVKDGLKTPIPSNKLHMAANSLLDLACRYKSQVLVQNLYERGDGLGRQDGIQAIQPVYKFRDYIHLSQVLEYKLPQKGLPVPVKVSSTDIFHTCHKCGCSARRNRLTPDIFICTQCGAAIDIDRLGSINLAGKLIKYRGSTLKIKTERAAEGIWFSNELINLKCYIKNDNKQHEKLKNHIQNALEDMKKSLAALKKNSRGKQASIIKKFENSSDPMNLIEFV